MDPIYGVLGNHDTIQMVPAMEAMGIKILLNECEAIVRGDQRIHLSGIDDAAHRNLHQRTTRRLSARSASRRLSELLHGRSGTDHRAYAHPR